MDGLEKFNTCKFRSINEILIGEKTCCKDNRYMGYLCLERNIEGVTPAKCDGCTVYIEKRVKKSSVSETDPFR